MKNTEVLIALSVHILECPENTYGKQCEQCGHCQNPQCDWTSTRGICFGGCTAGYKGTDCQTGIIRPISYSLSQVTFFTQLRCYKDKSLCTPHAFIMCTQTDRSLFGGYTAGFKGAKLTNWYKDVSFLQSQPSDNSHIIMQKHSI